VIPARHRTQLLMMLGEAAEIEHCLMCCYLYAAFSLKQSADEDLTAEEAEAVQRWRREVMRIATDEMLHLALANNLSVALGGRPHYRRFNFPISPGLFPADVVVELSPLDLDTLDHFVYLERPLDAKDQDGGRFEKLSYRRQGAADRLMPFADDYQTVGELYASIRDSVTQLVADLGEAAVFVGTREAQLSPRDFGMPGLRTIGTLEDAVAAVDFIVHQGEGSPQDKAGSHFSRFCAIRREWQRLLAARPAFTPHRPVARNPVMRSPILPGRVQVVEEPAIQLLDAGNVCYELMLHVLAATAELKPCAQQGQQRGDIVRQSLRLMQAVGEIGSMLSRLPANRDNPGVNAGLTFTVSRTELTFLTPITDSFALGERFCALAGRLEQLAPAHPQLRRHAEAMREHERFWKERYGGLRGEAPPAPPAAAPQPAAPLAAPAPAKPAEVVEGREVTLVFDSRRCIHSRGCVLGEPGVFIANKPGDWIYPDTATPERLSLVAVNCPSGAISVRRRDGVQEMPPPVNVVRVRENGPLAFHGELDIVGHPPGDAAPYRATLCRCGQSRNKPFCDGSHNEAKFQATGEPATRDSQPLPLRNGRLRVAPQRNGPLEVSGNLELCAGTGRTVDRLGGARFCRCGQSKDKPFCDGSHVLAGFEAEGA